VAGTGIVYIAFGERYLSEVLEAVESVRRHMPGSRVALLTDHQPLDPLVSTAFDTIQTVTTADRAQFRALARSDDPPESHRAFYNKILALSQTPFEETVFLDSDTRVCAPIPELFSVLQSVDLAAAHTPTRALPLERHVGWFLPTHNTGVLAYRKSATDEFFETWRRFYIDRYRDGEYSDQSVFDRAVAKSSVRHSSLPEELNYRVSAFGKLHGPVKILHGRDQAKLSETETFVNRTYEARVVIPEVGMLWLRDGNYEFLSYDDQEEPILLRRQQLLFRLSRLL
jgi:hypothetical protein